MQFYFFLNKLNKFKGKLKCKETRFDKNNDCFKLTGEMTSGTRLRNQFGLN